VLGLCLGRRLNGLTSGVVTMVKGCLLRPLQERWTQNKLDKDFCASAFDFVSFERRYLNTLKRQPVFYFLTFGVFVDLCFAILLMIVHCLHLGLFMSVVEFILQ